jgi:hypothetical protein
MTVYIKLHLFFIYYFWFTNKSKSNQIKSNQIKSWISIAGTAASCRFVMDQAVDAKPVTSRTKRFVTGIKRFVTGIKRPSGTGRRTHLPSVECKHVIGIHFYGCINILI